MSRPYRTHATVVRQRIARSLLAQSPHGSAPAPADDGPSLGTITLLPHQRDAVQQLHTMLAAMHVALLADDVGMGKTFVALAVAQRYPRCLVIAPAGLRYAWRDAMERAACATGTIWSLHQCSHTEIPPELVTPGTLVIIDEAHHLRSPNTRRYQTIASAVAGADLLLLSATPLHNRADDLRAVLGLRLGGRRDLLSSAMLTRLVVRRTLPDRRPVVRQEPAVSIPHDPRILDALLALPAPLPAKDGAIAGALIRLGLLRSWCSSDAALVAALKKRLLRSEAMQDALAAGRHPTRIELRSWIVGDGEMQLAFPELMASAPPADGPLRDVLTRHIAALRALLALMVPPHTADLQRGDLLRRLVAEHPTTPIVAFSQYRETIRSLARALTDIAGVGALTSHRAWIASGPLPRQELLAAFAPRGQGRPPPPPHQRVRLLLCTDLLAEGVNLQDAGIVVHLDLPWTDALRAQRIGRCVRLGSPHSTVSVVTLQIPAATEAVVQLTARLTTKAQLATRLVGRSGMGEARSAVDIAQDLRDQLSAWCRDEAAIGPGAAAVPPIDPGEKETSRIAPMVACIAATQRGVLAMIRHAEADRVQLIGGVVQRAPHGRRARLRVMTTPTALLALMQTLSPATGGSDECLARERVALPSPLPSPSPSPSPSQLRWWRYAERATAAFVRRQQLRAQFGSRAEAEPATVRQARRLVQQGIRGASPTQRGVVYAASREALEMLRVARGAAVDEALRAWMMTAAARPFVEWVGAWRSSAVLVRSAAGGDGPRSVAASSGAWHVEALLLMCPHASTDPDSFGGCPHARCSSISMAP
ncbi:MAG: DEAD/DEAH box helicase [Gemmatimonadaceae bacterium]